MHHVLHPVWCWLHGFTRIVAVESKFLHVLFANHLFGDYTIAMAHLGWIFQGNPVCKYLPVFDLEHVACDTNAALDVVRLKIDRVIDIIVQFSGGTLNTTTSSRFT